MSRVLLARCAAGVLVFGCLGGADIFAAFQPAQTGLKGQIKVTNFESKHLAKVTDKDGNPLSNRRRVSVYLPPGHDPKKTYPVLYCR